jgi:predicted negative regulator of RcsB-dependent stress response
MANQPYLPSESTDEPLYESQLDPFEIFWAKHKTSVIIGAVAVVALLIVGLSWFAVARSARLAGERAFADAKTAEAWRAVIAEHGGSVVAGNAALLLASSQRDAGKLDEATATLRAFVDAQPDHPMAPLAEVAIAENLALLGKADEAEAALQSVVDVDADSFAAPVAMLFKAELLLAEENRNEALKTYQRLADQYPTSVAAQSAEPVYRELEAMARPAGAEAPVADE